MTIRPITLREANAYVAQHHRHNQPTNGHKWSIACYDGERLCGVAICGQPIARKLDDGLTVEIRRVCTDGTYNACSILYGACSRVARDMGYRRVITYTLISEPGASLKASGFINCGEAGGTSWNMTIVLDDMENVNREKKMKSSMDGIHARQVFFYVAADEFGGPLPAQDTYLTLDGGTYRVVDATDEFGMYAITLEANRSR